MSRPLDPFRRLSYGALAACVAAFAFFGTITARYVASDHDYVAADTVLIDNLSVKSSLVTQSGATESFGGDLNMNSHRVTGALAFDSTHSGVVPASGGGSVNVLHADGTFGPYQTFGASNSGIVPASGGGSTNVLHADGSWGPVTGVTPNSSWFGSGVDGDLVFDGTTTVDGVTPVGNVYTMNRDIVGRNVTVNVGVRVWLHNWAFMASAQLTNNGTIDNNGNPGLTNSSTGAATPDGRFKAGSFANFQNVGSNTTNVPKYYIIASAGGVPNGGAGHAGGGDGGAGGVDNAANGGLHGGSTTVTTAANVITLEDLFRGYQQVWNAGPGVTISPLQFGAAGGSGGFHSFCAADAAGGGAGGGMTWVAARTVTGTGSIQARGGNGANGTGCPGGGGGGGGGGMVVFIYETQSGQTVDANGGLGGSPTNGGGPGGNGGSGYVYRVNLSGDGT